MSPLHLQEMAGLNFRYGVLPNGFSMLALHLTLGLQARGKGEDASRAAVPFSGWCLRHHSERQ